MRNPYLTSPKELRERGDCWAKRLPTEDAENHARRVVTLDSWWIHIPNDYADSGSEAEDFMLQAVSIRGHYPGWGPPKRQFPEAAWEVVVATIDPACMEEWTTPESMIQYGVGVFQEANYIIHGRHLPADVLRASIAGLVSAFLMGDLPIDTKDPETATRAMRKLRDLYTHFERVKKGLQG